MNPKDMTNMQLVEAIKDQRFSLVDETKELLRRLNERDQYKIQWENCNSDFHFAVEQADALRKENEELRKFLDTDAAGRPLYVLLHDAWSVSDNGPLADCLHERSVALEAIDYDALNARIESAKQKEASHE